MMYKDDIELLNEWFDNSNEDRSSDTYRHDKDIDGEDVYVVHSWDMDDFCKFLTDTFPDLIGIDCMVGSNGIWFRSDDLKKAEFL